MKKRSGASIQSFGGSIAFETPDAREISKAIERESGKSIVIDFVWESYLYTTTLNERQDNPDYFSGVFEVSEGGKKVSGRVNARRYRSADGTLILVGEWNEDGETHDWFFRSKGHQKIEV